MDISLLRKEGYSIEAWSSDNNYIKFSSPSGLKCILSSKLKYTNLFGKTIESELRIPGWGVSSKIGRTNDKELLEWMKYVIAKRPTCYVDPKILENVNAALSNRLYLNHKQYYVDGTWMKGGTVPIFSTKCVGIPESVASEIVYLVVEFRESGDVYLKVRTDTIKKEGCEVVVSQPVKMSAISDITDLFEREVTMKKLELIDYLPKSEFKFKKNT